MKCGKGYLCAEMKVENKWLYGSGLRGKLGG